MLILNKWSFVVFDTAVDDPGFVLILHDLVVDEDISSTDWPYALHLNVNLAGVHGILFLGNDTFDGVRVIFHS